MSTTLHAPRAAEATPRLADNVGGARREELDRFAVATVEENRWLLYLGTPFLLSAVFFALAIGVSEWFMVPAVILGPGLMIAAYVYLGLSSDTNGQAGAVRSSPGRT